MNGIWFPLFIQELIYKKMKTIITNVRNIMDVLGECI